MPAKIAGVDLRWSIRNQETMEEVSNFFFTYLPWLACFKFQFSGDEQRLHEDAAHVQGTGYEYYYSYHMLLWQWGQIIWKCV